MFGSKNGEKRLIFANICAILTLALPKSGKRFGPRLTSGGSSCPLISRKGGCGMTTSEVFQLLLVLIGICDLFIQAYKKK